MKQEPKGVRRATLFALAMGGLVSFSAARELPVVFAAESIDTPEMELGQLKGLVSDPKALKEASQAAFRAQVTAIESMRVSRGLILLGLSVSSALVFVAAMRLRALRMSPPDEDDSSKSTRGTVARLLGGAALASAVLRTADGAQLLVIVRRGAVAFEKVAARSAATDLQTVELDFAQSALSVMFTVFVVAAFVLLGGFFRSPHVHAGRD